MIRIIDRYYHFELSNSFLRALKNFYSNYDEYLFKIKTEKNNEYFLKFKIYKNKLMIFDKNQLLVEISGYNFNLIRYLILSNLDHLEINKTDKKIKINYDQKILKHELFKIIKTNKFMTIIIRPIFKVSICID